MKVYIDVLLLVNFFFDFLLLLSVKIILKRKTSIIRIILASLIGEFTCITLFLPLSNISLMLIKLLLSIVIIITAFGYKSSEYFKKNFLYFYLFSIILGGLVYFLKITFITTKDMLYNLVILLVIAPYLLCNYLKEVKSYKSNYTLRHDLEIYLDGKLYNYTAYLDTGNKLKDPYKKRPILLVYDEKLKFSYEDSILVPYKTIDNEGVIKCHKVDKVIVDKRVELTNILIGKSYKKFNIEGIDVILPNIIKEEL